MLLETRSTIFLLCALFGSSYAIIPGLETIVRAADNLNPLHLLFQNKCIENLDCFYTGPPFYDPINRPISLAPSSDLQTIFYLFTPANPENHTLLQPTVESIENSSFNPNLETKVLIHGYRSELEDEQDVRFQIKDEILQEGPYNVIVVNWSYNNGPPYLQAVANARAVGVQVANLLNFIIETMDINAENIHIIGHSLGAQMAGWIGERVHNLGRITGLDPAGPYFQGAPSEIRLDTSDAHFVDVIHTDGGENFVTGLGISEPIGHMDFYPNGGRTQPACESESGLVVGRIVNEASKKLLNSCSHNVVNEYFLESIKRKSCRFYAVHCTSYDSYQLGECTPENVEVAEMGFHAKKIPRLPVRSKFFLKTNSTSPYCTDEFSEY
ncbi:Pancreatic triacylglycerol lipase, partial [Stegodyphus mimosarum]